MRRFALLSFLLILINSLSGQNILNPGFETWISSGKPAPFDWKEPFKWKTNNAVTEFISATVSPSTIKKDGQFSCQIKTINVFGQEVSGMVANGEPGVEFSTYSVIEEQVGTPFVIRPESIGGYYQYIADSSDQGIAVCLLKRWNSISNHADTIGYGIKALTQTDVFIPFEITLEYWNKETPDSLALIFYSSDPNTIQNGSILRVDQLVVNESSATKDLTEEKLIEIFPNPSNGYVHFKFKPNVRMGNIDIQVYDALGRKIKDCPLQDLNEEGPLSPGVYLIEMRDGNKAFIQIDKLIVQ